MPVRKIPQNYLFVTGGFASRKASTMVEFESLLEKDHLILLEFDNSVATFDAQPVRISVPGIRNGYVPDVLIHFNPEVECRSAPDPLLVEVKAAADLKRNEKKYAPKFAAASRFAAERGWRFEIRDEALIRTPRLANLKFLREYRNVHPDAAQIQQVLDWIGNSQTSSTAILNGLARTDEAKLRLLPVLWSMLQLGHLVTDIDQAFTDDVPLARAQVAA